MKKFPYFNSLIYKEENNSNLYHIKFDTKIRLIHTDGKYYLTPYLRVWHKLSLEQIHSAYQEFIIEGITLSKMMKVVPDLKDNYGKNLFVLDENQEDEKILSN